jgi:hypothetical protein
MSGMELAGNNPAIAELPVAGPGAQPHLIEIDVAPWHTISVLFRAAKASRAEEAGTIWYWSPGSMSRVDRDSQPPSDRPEIASKIPIPQSPLQA